MCARACVAHRMSCSAAVTHLIPLEIDFLTEFQARLVAVRPSDPPVSHPSQCCGYRCVHGRNQFLTLVLGI